MPHRHALHHAGLLIAAFASLLALGCGSTAGGPSANSPATGTSAPASEGPAGSAPETTPAPARAATTPPVTPSGGAPAAGLPAGYLPLYPFASLADVRAWQAAYGAGGHQPWHLSPTLTATAFAAFLGYTGVTEVSRSSVRGGDAHVAIGIRPPNGTVSTAAIIHLLRFGSGQYTPWEVVGTDDTTFSLSSPAYGSTVSSPATVGGTITGVDESIRVTVRGLSMTGPAGAYCCLAAGGSRSHWSARVTFHAPRGQVITIAASTGGHLAAVERFTVTGARAG